VVFTLVSVDITGLQMTHNIAQKFKIEATTPGAGALDSLDAASIGYVSAGTYRVAVRPLRAGNYTLTALVLELGAWVPMTDVVRISATCSAAQGLVVDPNGDCVCQRGRGLAEGRCAICARGYFSGEETNSACVQCADPTTTTVAPGAESAAECVCARGYFRGVGGECIICGTLEGVDVSTCKSGTSVETLQLLPNYWRHSARSTQILRCNPSLTSNRTTCQPNTQRRRELQSFLDAGELTSDVRYIYIYIHIYVYRYI